MELNHNSLSARLYRFYVGHDNMPTNLCPYFWKLVLVYLTVIPLTLLALPTMVMEKLTNSHKYSTKWVPLVKLASGGFIIYVLIYLVLSMLFASGAFIFGYNYIPEENEVLSFLGFTQSIGLMLVSALVCIGIGGLIVSTVIMMLKLLNSDYQNRRDSNVMIQFVKAKYNRYCPQIQWKHTKE